ncbi:MAG: DNA polymerase III subunit delta [Gemmataceae bacterium]|nr:DNA polymerase III subunit delta [Gemmataceae bacterium]
MEVEQFLKDQAKLELQPVYVITGSEDYLRRKAGKALKQLILAGNEDLGLASFVGDKTSFAEVREELTTLSFFGGKRLAWVEQADDFVSKNRPALEKYFQSPSTNGVLILETSSWPSNTKLSKMLAKDGLITCEAPSRKETLVAWCISQAKNIHEKPLANDAATLLVELIGPELGRLDQEIAKLACYAADNPKISAKDVDMLVGQGHVEKVWVLFDHIGQGNPRAAFQLLFELFEQGEEPMKLLGAFSSHLRKLAYAGRFAMQDKPMAFALEKAGFFSFTKTSAEAQLRRIGRKKINKILTWLIETDTGMKGGSQIPPKTLMERLLAMLCSK